jgi:hypothetical protein
MGTLLSVPFVFLALQFQSDSKMKLFNLFFAFLIGFTPLFGQNQAPIISNLTLQTDIPNNSAVLFFDLSDAENDPLEVTVQFSSNNGKTYSTLSGINITGDTGYPVSSGSKSVQCSGLDFSTPAVYRFRVVADDKQPFDIQALVNEVDTLNLINNLKVIEGIRHRTTGLAHLNNSRNFLKNHFEEAGLHFEKHLFPYGTATGENLIASTAGTSSSEKVVIVDAHYDTVSNAPGADDNGSGTVGVMEIARLLSRYPSKKTQRYIGFDLEEAGLIGSIRYVSNGIPASEQIEGVFNFEMIGYWSDQPNTQELPTGFEILFPTQTMQIVSNQYRGDFINNINNSNSEPLALVFNDAAQTYVPDLKVITLTVPGNGEIAPDLRRSDHTPFWESNRKALMLSDGANFRNECYHTPLDVAHNKLNFTFMSNVVKATLAAMAQMVEIQHGDWETISYSTISASPEVNPCGFRIVQSDAIYLETSDCLLESIQVEIFDAKGVLLQENQINLGEGIQLLNTEKLNPGAYFLKISHPKGIFSQKLILR